MSSPIEMRSIEEAATVSAEDDARKVEDASEKYEEMAFSTPGTIFTLIDLLVGSALLFLPALLVLFLHQGFERYNLIKVKPPSIQLNGWMEFVRVSLYASVAYGSWVFLLWLWGTAPKYVYQVAKLSGWSGSSDLRRQVGYVRACYTYLATANWLLFLWIIGSWVAYRSVYWGKLSQVVAAIGGANKAAAAAQKVAEIQAQRTFKFYIERTLLAASLISGLIALEKYVVKLVEIHFNETSFADRIRNLNFELLVFEVLAKGPPTVIQGTRGQLKAARTLRWSNVKQIREQASDLFASLCPPHRDHLLREDLQRYFPFEELAKVMRVLDPTAVGVIYETEFVKAMEEHWRQVANVQSSQEGNRSIMNKLDRTLLILALFVGVSMAIPFFSSGVVALISTLGVLLASFTFMLQGVGKTIFDSFIFVFIQHPFDVGDRVTIDGQNLIVQRIELFQTIFTEWNGNTVYIQSGQLSQKSIYNVRRSGCQCDLIDLTVLAGTTSEQLGEFRQALLDFTANQPRDYTGYVEITHLDLAGGDRLKLQLMVEYRSNFQDQALRNARHNRFVERMRALLRETGIES